MKKIILAFTVVLFIAACKDDADLETKIDTVGVVKDSLIYHNNILADTAKISADILNKANMNADQPLAKKNKTYAFTTPRTNPPTAKRRTYSSSNIEVMEPSVGSTTPTSSGTGNTNSGNGTDGNTTTTGGATANIGGSSEAQPTVQKEGWSKAAQGAAIGGVAGAIGGAIISKKKGKGAIIGGIIGAGGGYVIGRAKDKKDGRVQK